MNYFFETRSHFLEERVPISIYRNVNFHYMAHWHTDIEIVYVEKGSICISINSEKEFLNDGDIAIIVSGDIHYYESQNTDSSAIILVFKPEYFDLPQIQNKKHKITPQFIKKDQLDEFEINVKEIFYEILKEHQNNKIYYDLLIGSHIVELYVTLLRNLSVSNIDSSKKSFTTHELMQHILTYLEDNYTSPDISLKDISDQFNINIFNLSKMFNKVIGTNFKNYINNLKIVKAEYLIKNTSTPFIDIAIECGFNNIRNFNRVYKNIKGYPPSEDRIKTKERENNIFLG